MEPGAFAQRQPIPAGLGRRVPAGPGKKVPAGQGRGQWRTFDVAAGLADPEVERSIVQDREGHLWFATDGGASRYDGRNFKTFTTRDGLADDRVAAILQDREGNLWFGTYGGGVSRYDGERFTTLTTEDGLAHDTVAAIFQDREGDLWFGTGGGVSRYDGERFTTFTTRDGLAHDTVAAIFQDREGCLWFGTAGGGASRYDGRNFTTFTTRDGLVDDYVRSLFQDREGYLWFGTGGGVSRYDENSIRTFTTKDGLPHDIVLTAFQDREGKVWFGTRGGGVCRYDGEYFTTFTVQDGLPHGIVRSIFQDRDGYLWFGTEGGGVCRYDGQGWTTFTIQDGLASNGVWCILQDREGNLWFGTGGGVSRYEGKGFETFVVDGQPVSRVWSIFQDREGCLWLGTYGGVSRYDGQGWTTFTTKDGLAHNEVRSICQDREGNLWFATRKGASRYDGQGFRTFTAQDGLAHDKLRSVFQDQDGYLWFGTYGGGVNRYDGEVFQSLTHQDGLAGNEVTWVMQDREGCLWFATLKGVTRYRPAAAPLPLMRIDTVVADRRYARATELNVPASAKLIAFEYHGVSFKTRPGGMVYWYRLQGYEEEGQSTRARRVEYQDLAPGEYTFQVQAIDRDLVYSEPATVKLSVVPDPHVEALSHALNASGIGGELVGKSAALRRVQAQLEGVAHTEVTVLILGETGTGKGLAARTVHALSQRRAGLFVQVNCGAIPEGLVESELFGHERGAFTGAISRKLGRVELAQGGTLFLDEVGDLAPSAQAKLLELLEERAFERVGGTQTLKADVRVIAATNRDLGRMVTGGQFREDLYFRLSGFPVRMPPLRERREDIPLLAAYFAGRMGAHLNKRLAPLATEVLGRLGGYEWPGNVRELEHVMQRAVIVCQGGRVRVEEIVLGLGEEGGEPAPEVLTPEEYERRYLRQALEQAGWVIGGAQGAAVLLGLPESTLRSRMKKLGIVRG